MMREARHGFTIVELTIVLSLMIVGMSLVIVRFDWGGPRQNVVSEARKLGRLISTYREKAIDEERSYALTLDLNAGRYTIIQTDESSTSDVQQTRPLVDAALAQPIRFSAVSVQNKALASPITIFFAPRGIMPELRIEVGIDKGPVVIIRIDPLANEVGYDDR